MNRRLSLAPALKDRLDLLRRVFVDLRKPQPDALLSALQSKVGRNDPRFLSMEVSAKLCPSPRHGWNVTEDELILADFGVLEKPGAPSAFPVLDAEFKAEVELMRAKRTELREAELTNEVHHERGRDFDVLQVANAASMALEDWDTYALPYRLRDGVIVEIRSPSSWASLQPTVIPYSADRFLAWMTKECALLSARCAQLQAQRTMLVYLVVALAAVLTLKW